jgi:hypothetical protein
MKKPEVATILKNSTTFFFILNTFCLESYLLSHIVVEIQRYRKWRPSWIILKESATSRHLEHFLFKKFFARSHCCRDAEKQEMAAILNLKKNSTIFSQLEYFSFEHFFARLRRYEDTEIPEIAAILDYFKRFGNFSSFGTLFV